MHLLVATPALEVTEIYLEPGARLFLTPPPESGRATEVYMVLAGKLECGSNTLSTCLGPGASITVDNLAGNLILSAATSVRLLYISSRPFFHQISDTVEELMVLATEVELKDGYTADHCERLQRLS